MDIGKTLKYLRTSELISQEKMAGALGIKRSTYKEYELEYSIIPITHLNEFCNYFDKSIDYIFNFTKEEKYVNSRKSVDLNTSSKRLKEIRKENNLTQKELSKLLGIDKSTLSKYENAKNLIATQFLYEICKRYKISADYLLGKTNKKSIL